MPAAERGSAVVEFAFVVPLVLVVLLGAVEVTLVARAQLEVSHAAREGAREAAASPDPSRAVATVRAVLDLLESAGVEAESLTVHTPDLDDVFLALTETHEPAAA